MRRPSHRALIAFPIATYLLVLLFVAAFVTTPSTLGWIGFAVAAALAVLVAALAATLFPRMRANARREHPRVGDPFRLLVAVDADCSVGALRDAILDRAPARDAEIVVVAPVLASPLHYLTEAEAAERSRARLRLHDLLDGLARGGLAAQGFVGADDPLVAIGDALAAFPAAEILLVADDDARRGWLERGLERAVRDAYGVHVTTVAAALEPALVS
jgi:hypothetical protein